MSRAITIHETGGPDVLTIEDREVGEPGEGEVKVRHEAIGLNFIDTYFRSGLYPAPKGLPLVLGNEGAGTVIAVGSGVADFAAGDRVAYCGALGAYADERLIAARHLVRLPESIDFVTAAAMLLKGLTAQYLLRQTFRLEPGQTVLIHAAAGGVGLIACQWANHLGATVIGTVGSPEKAALAESHGCHHTINYAEQDFVEEVARITDGGKCDVVYDSVGQATCPASLDCLKRRGTWVTFGQSSGLIEDFDLGLLARKGSLYACRPTLFTYTAEPGNLALMAGELFELVAAGTVRIEVNQTFPLAEAASAHRALEGRRTTGSTVLLP